MPAGLPHMKVRWHISLAGGGSSMVRAIPNDFVAPAPLRSVNVARKHQLPLSLVPLGGSEGPSARCERSAHESVTKALIADAGLITLP